MQKLTVKTKRILAALGGAAIVLALLLAVDAVTGDPVSRAWAQRQALRYAQTQYPDCHFTVAGSQGGQAFRYYFNLQAQESADIRIDCVSGWRGIEDTRGSAAEQVLWNTAARMGREAAELAAAELASEAPELELQPAFGAEQQKVEIDLGWQPDAEYTGVGAEDAAYLAPDAPFTKTVLQNVPSRLVAQVLWHGQPTQQDMQTVLQTIKRVLEKNEMPVTWYDITLLPDDSTDYDDLRARMVESGPVHRDDIKTE